MVKLVKVVINDKKARYSSEETNIVSVIGEMNRGQSMQPFIIYATKPYVRCVRDR